MHINIKQRVFNDTFLPYLHCETPVQIFFGGASSGKSVFIAQRYVLDNATQGRNILVVRNVGNTLRTTCFTEVRKAINFFQLTPAYQVNQSDMTITNLVNDSQFIFRGLDDVEKLKSITALSGPITDIWIEEATEIGEPSLNQLLLRLRGRTLVPKRVTVSFNPINRQHWIYRRYFSRYEETVGKYQDDHLLIHHSVHKDNRFLDKADHARIEDFKNVDPYIYAVYAQGKWGVLGSLIFTNWSVADLSAMKDKFNQYRNGCDFGFTNDPTALVRCAIRNNTIYILREEYQRGWTNDVIAAKARAMVGRELLYCDCAEPKSIAEIRGDPKNPVSATAVKKGKDSVLHGIQWLQRHEIVIDKSCQNMVNEVSIYQWQKDKYGDAINVPVATGDHLIDATRYAFERDMVGVKSMLRGTAEIDALAMNTPTYEDGVPTPY